MILSNKISALFLGLIIIVAPILLIGGASATSLPIAKNQLTNKNNVSCTSLTFNAAVNSNNQLVLSGIPAACYGNSLITRVVYNNSTLDTSFTATLSTPSITFTSPTLRTPVNVIGVRTLVNGWNIPTTWTYNNVTNDPIQPNPSTPGITLTITWNQTAATQFCSTVDVKTTSVSPLPWKADLLFTDPPFNGDTNTTNYQLTNGFVFVSNTPVNGRFTVQGNSGANNTVSASTPQQFTICNYGTPPPAVSTTAIYSQTETIPVASYYVCKQVTVTVTNAPFYVGWVSQVDITDLKNLYLGTGGQVQGPYGGYSRTLVSGNVYNISGTDYNTSGIRNNSPITYEICWG